VRIKTICDSIAFRISVTIAVVIAASMVAVGWLILREEQNTLEMELQKKGTYLAKAISRQVSLLILSRDSDNIYSILKSYMIDEDSLIVYAEINDTSGKTIVKAFRDEKFSQIQLPPHDLENPSGAVEILEDKNTSIYHISLPVTHESGGTVGLFRMCITKEFLYNTFSGVKKKLYLLAAAVTFIGVMLGLYMARKVLKPVLVLNKGVQRIIEGEVGVEVPVVGEGEIKQLSLSFNRMSVKLKKLIDEIKSAQENLIKTEKLYAVGEFSAGIAHEIKNPLTPIKMLISTAKDKKKPLTDRDIDVIDEEISRIDGIVKGFLAFARPESSEKTKVKINSLLQEVIAVTRAKMEQSDVQLVENYLPTLSEISGNHDSLKQVFLNIILNAMQAMDGDGGTLTVETFAENGNIEVAIRDTGVGISKKDVKKIFDPFFTTKKEGTGMGLALTYTIVNDHSGKIEMDSTLGVGSVVKVKLPANKTTITN
jgi:signal transduction histidine kinase